jgi:hypothetical protein
VGSSKRKIVKRVEKSGSSAGAPKNEDVETAEEKWIEKEQYSDDSFFAVGREIIREEGVTGLWLGIKPGLVLTVNPAITYGAYERVKSIILVAQEKAAAVSSSAPGKLTPGTNFLVGALSKTLATVVTYPYIMAKVRIQTRGSDAQASDEARQSLPPHHAYHHEKSKHPGAVELLANVYRKEGLVGWYQVSPRRYAIGFMCLTDIFTGDGGPNSQGRPFSSVVIHVQGPIRTLDPVNNGVFLFDQS